MQVTETRNEGLKREFKVVVASKDIDAKLEVRLGQIGERVQVPGFRPGKVPLQVLRQRFGQSVMGEVLEQAVQDSSSQAMDERGLRPAMRPEIEITSFDRGQDLEYTMAVELLPEIEVMDLSKLEIERLKVEVPESEVDKAVESLAGRRKQTEPLKEERAAESGDVLVIDFGGSVDGETLPGMVGEDHHLELGSNQFVGTFEEQLVGANKGDDRTVTVTFPDGYANETLSGREAVFEVKVKDILASVPPTVDDAFAQSFGEADLEALRATVREQIEKDYDEATRSRLKRQVLDSLAGGHDFQLPDGMVETEFEAIWRRIERDRQAGNQDPEDEGKSDDDLKAEYRQIAERRVRLGLVLSEVGRQNDIQVSQEEVTQAMMREVRQNPGQERQILELFRKSPEALANLRAPIFEDKVVDFIADLASVTERPVAVEELTAIFEADTAAVKQKDVSGAKDDAAAERSS